ncbi:hypothetical protein [Roseivivax lentus]|nr:hypothetical protein [Roseivivax lentus]
MLLYAIFVEKPFYATFVENSGGTDMTEYREGDRSRAICSVCGHIVSTTFALRDVPFDAGIGVVPNVLAAVCDNCGGVVAIPAQSTNAIARAHEALRG